LGRTAFGKPSGAVIVHGIMIGSSCLSRRPWSLILWGIHRSVVVDRVIVVAVFIGTVHVGSVETLL
jgi:hypothetical protein